jgi:TRAP-type C4-dicarboxylate transport system substrate-binding protein
MRTLTLSPAYRIAITLSLLAIGASQCLQAQGVVRIRVGTIVPKGSLWDESLQYVRQEWRRISGGTVQVTIHSGGVLGDETEMVGQIRQGRIQAVALSSVGLSQIDEAVSCLQIPMMFKSYAEFDYARVRLAPLLERRIEARGFKVLNWAEGGWVHTFTRTVARTPDDVRRMKVFTPMGDAATGRLYDEFGFHVVPLAASDLITALRSGKVDAFSTVPLLAEFEQSYTRAPHMIDVPWMPLVGATLISQQAWEQIPAASRAGLLAAAQAAGERLRSDVRAMGDQAVREMEKRGLTVIQADAATRDVWRSSAESTYGRLRGSYCPADLFDEVTRLRNEARRQP